LLSIFFAPYHRGKVALAVELLNLLVNTL